MAAARKLSAVLKIVPLGVYARAVWCKFGGPGLACDAPLCPVAINKSATDDCVPTGNTAELKAWCEHGWAPWLNGLLTQAGAPAIAICSEPEYALLKIFGLLLAIGYAALWLAPKFGSLFLTLYMCAGLHFHLTFLKDEPAALGLQFALLGSSIVVFFIECFFVGGGSPARAAGKPTKKNKSKKVA